MLSPILFVLFMFVTIMGGDLVMKADRMISRKSSNIVAWIAFLVVVSGYIVGMYHLYKFMLGDVKCIIQSSRF